mmetsp:Transcript_17706/g.30079  ORF Transcript_17706/g.30079 Transcript_17706/m.30079 type:complete len:285 (+) Transcript_17706:422-1276(+)|eukprot:CAMPEP_0203751218 /NCGR_PEP_ID=MMETSP0098-20131031/5321_1 /ASSEMBLY_ACC=CAM_ASM_000208 /TAXON_ID=96639 /ORGANISM=" , Strain NY0313808BC1" /LENGTH=284 /DNA_ID=CAMNT_0050640835 /DNA_START=365 /DNA_END=1219 /DNA_ORIENTATION=-
MFGKLRLKKKTKPRHEDNGNGNAFGYDDDDDLDDGPVQVSEKDRRKIERKVVNERLERENKANLEKVKAHERQHMDVFQYDQVYEKESSKANSQSNQEAAAPQKSKYIEQLLATAKKRDMQHERAREKVILREQEEEAKVLGAADQVFVTGAYKRRLEERKRAELEEMDKEAQEDVLKKDDLSGFYSGVLSQISRTNDTASVTETEREQPSSTETPKPTLEEKTTNLETVTRPKLEHVTESRQAQDSQAESPSKQDKAPKSTVTPLELEQARARALERARTREK